MPGPQAPAPGGDAPGHFLPVGTRLGEFEIQSVIGEGGFGIVYLAHDHSLQRRVALKEYMPSSLTSRVSQAQIQVRGERHIDTFAAGLKAFINEARLLASFDHPSLVKVYRFWEANGTAYMVMPFIEGTTLKQVLRGLGSRPDEAWLRRLLSPLTEVLQLLHSEHCYHRDIAPDNVMLLSNVERWLLLDFGAARRVIGDMTQALTVILKPGYAPVEQYTEIPGMQQGPWTDVYALAAVVYFAIMGKTPPASVGRLLNDTYVPLARAARGSYSDHFLSAVDRALTVRPEDRTRSIDEFRRDLGLGEAPVGSATSPPSTSAGRPQPVDAPDPGDRTRIRPATDRSWSQGPEAVFSDHTQWFGTPRGRSAAAVAPPSLIVMGSDSAPGGQVATMTGERLEIGRDCDGLRLVDPECSRRHAAIVRTERGYRIVDLGSSGATHVNGRAVPRGGDLPLPLGSKIRIGSTLMSFVQSDSALSDLSGAELAGRYQLHQQLRVSSKSALYRASLKGSELPLAIKILASQLSGMQDYLAQFETEAAIARKLRHPHICELRDHGSGTVVHRGVAMQVTYLCYSLLAGGNLSERVSPATLPPVPLARTWIAHVADALQYAHERGVIHGNIKPSSVCFDEGEHAYITDFAMAGSAQSSGVLLGSPPFMAPEQWAGQDVTAQTDQYSLAALAYLLLSGAQPFVGQDDPVLRDRNLRRGPEPAHLEAQRQNRDGLTPRVSQVLERALLADPGARFPGVAAFAAALHDAFAPQAAAPRGPDVFISYQREPSSGWAILIQQHLRDKHGIKAFVDSQGLDGAVHFPDKLAQAIAGCGVFVCLLGKSTLKARWVREEIRLAHLHQRPMIPIFLKGFRHAAAPVDDPAVRALMHFDGLDLIDQYAHHMIADLGEQIRITLGRPKAP